MLAGSLKSDEPSYQQSTRSAQFLLQTIRKGARSTRLVRVELLDGVAKASERGDKRAKQDPAPVRREVGVVPSTEHAVEIVVLVEGLAQVATLLLVPPVCVRVAVLALHRRRVDVAAVLQWSIAVSRIGPCVVPHVQEHGGRRSHWEMVLQ